MELIRKLAPSLAIAFLGAAVALGAVMILDGDDGQTVAVDQAGSRSDVPSLPAADPHSSAHADAAATAGAGVVNNNNVTVVVPPSPAGEATTSTTAVPTTTSTAPPVTTTTAPPTTTTTVFVNHDPVAMSDWYYVPVGTQRGLRVLENDSDADGDSLFIADFTQPQEGHVELDAARQSFTYTPPAEYTFGGTQYTVIFSYFVGDGRGARTPGSVNVSILPPEVQPPA